MDAISRTFSSTVKDHSDSAVDTPLSIPCIHQYPASADLKDVYSALLSLLIVSS